ncbi:MAG: diguanylate cyclase [Lachnospiraceae bacterium]|nr:diguanylate cyclase [Lachnospiraceae bacterium]
MEIRTIVVSVIIIMAMTASFLLLFVKRTNRSISRNMTSMMAANSQQLKSNMDNYLDQVENYARLMFGNEEFIRFTTTNPSISAYDRTRIKGEIGDYIEGLGFSINFSDFGIVYSDDDSVGRISQTTSGLFSNGGMYDYFSSIISDHVEENGWACRNDEDNFGRLIYVKRLNENAIIVASFYSRELEDFFQFPDRMKGVTASLTDEDNTILFSSDKFATGTSLSANALSPLEGNMNGAGYNKTYFTSADTLKNGWKVYCYAPADVLMSDSKAENVRLLVLTVSLTGGFLVAFVILLRFVTEPMNGMVDSLEEKADTDGLTGLFNKATFEKKAAETIGKIPENGWFVVIMIDVDHFKGINDKYGHAMGDVILQENARAMSEYIQNAAAIGRVGGDEFAACYAFSLGRPEEIQKIVAMEVNRYRAVFHNRVRDKKIEASTSVGIMISQVPGEDFDQCYLNADRALYESKRNGRNRVTWFVEDRDGLHTVDEGGLA